MRATRSLRETSATSALCRIVILALCVACGPGSAFAIGTTTIRRAEDFVLTIDSTWTGGGSGGYFPIRVRVQNRGPGRSLTFRFVPVDEPAPSVRRTIDVPQNAVVSVTLSIPCVTHATYGRLEVLQQGRMISEFSETVALPDPGFPEYPSMLVITADEVDMRGFEDGSAVYAEDPWSYGVYGGGSADFQLVDPTMLPRSWVDYTALDLVAVSMPVLEAISDEQRSAILDWVLTGGTLIVHDVGKDPPISRELTELLRLDEHAAASNAWSAPDAEQRKPPIYNEELNGLVIPGTTWQPDEIAEATWPENSLFRRSLGQGRIYALEQDAFPGSPTDWRWLVDDLGPNRTRWILRHGMSPRQANAEFLQFLIPSVRGVPVGVILALITLFAIVIGPLNYLYLWQKSRLYLLVLTIPGIALGTSITLFAYSAVSHGFGVRSRVRSLTILDQRANTSHVTARVALYAGLAPSDGLRFSPETAVYPVWSPNAGTFDQATIDWTELQHFESGWLRSRTRTQFMVSSLRDQRGRLEVTVDGQEVSAANGLEWDIAAVVACTEDGRMWSAEQLPAGSSTTLSPLSDGFRERFAELIDENAPRLPERLTQYDSGPFSSISPYEGFDVESPQQFAQGMFEKNLDWLRGISSSRFSMPRNSYVAVLAEDPGVDVGVEETDQEASLHVLVGHY